MKIHFKLNNGKWKEKKNKQKNIFLKIFLNFLK